MRYDTTPQHIHGNPFIQNNLFHSSLAEPHFAKISYLYIITCITVTLSTLTRTPGESLWFYGIMVTIISIIMPVIALNIYHFLINKKNFKRLQRMDQKPLPDENRMTKRMDDRENRCKE